MTGGQVRFGSFQGFLTGRTILLINVTLASVETRLEESNLVNPVVLVMLVSHSLG